MAQVMTVLGPIPAKELGFTLPHEHIFLDLWSWPGGKSSVGLAGIFDPDLDGELMANELATYQEAGGRSLVEVSLKEIGRDPVALKRIAEVTGVNIIMGCGWYRDSFTPEYVHYRPTEQLAQLTAELIRQGYAHRLLLSHDICHRALLKRYGGVGYTGLIENFIPLLKQHRVDEEAIHTMTVENPSRVLAI